MPWRRRRIAESPRLFDPGAYLGPWRAAVESRTRGQVGRSRGRIRVGQGGRVARSVSARARRPAYLGEQQRRGHYLWEGGGCQRG